MKLPAVKLPLVAEAESVTEPSWPPVAVITVIVLSCAAKPFASI